MSDPLAQFLSEETLTDEQRRRLQAALADDPALRQAMRQWGGVIAHTRHQMDEALPSRELLVLYALDTSPYAEALTEEENAALSEARVGVERALERHPGLQAVVRDVQSAAVDFDRCWSEHTSAAAKAPARHAPRAADRPVKKRGRHRAGSWQYVGLIVAILIGVGVLMLWPREPSLTVVEGIAGETHEVALPDGTTIRLAEEAQVAFLPEDRFDRVVEARGGTYFSVASGEAPFRVTTSTAEVEVLGTTFAVDATDEATEIVLTTGRLAVRSAGGEVRLNPGERSEVLAGAAPSDPTSAELNEALAWTGLLFFEETPMTEVADILRARFEQPVEVDTALSDERVTGTFDADVELMEVATALAATLSAEAEPLEDGVRIVATP